MSEVTKSPIAELQVIRDHRRSFDDNRYVYAVVSRRSKGVSIGVNLNPDKVCNFDCIYCQVDRRTPATVRDVELPRLLAELREMVEHVVSGQLFAAGRFANTPLHLRRLNDVAFSGDGEPTTSPEFPAVVAAAAELRRERRLDDLKLIVITNATRLHHPPVAQALQVLDANNGEIWAKLEAGTEAYYHAIERTTVPFAKVLANITSAAQAWPIVIQSMFLKMHGVPPSAAELGAYCDRLNEILQAGGKIKLVQVYTVARDPAETWVSSLSDAEVDGIVGLVRERTGLPAEAFYGNGT